ncbi:PadR family transcriptional regulator [Candidatus Saccharibacteria bacterium]|nr:PadR family transcriptional regulator [Candidatus Saccharibacteria bacterium]MCB9821413.1 PadR family transcriptional regulator [Candidatus Nomurabacteria bacterium]
MRKGLIEYCVMQICSGKPVYVGEIVTKLKDTDLIVVEGTLYPLLSRLASEKLVSYEWKESKTGPPRKYYKLTVDGHGVLEAYNSQWKELKKAVDGIIKGVKK